MTKRSERKGDPFYLTKEWEALRSKRLRMDRFRCAHCNALCLGKGKGMPSPQVDHIKTRKDRPDLALDIDNLRTLCHPCHSKRTRADQLNRTPIGADGYPIQ